MNRRKFIAGTIAVAAVGPLAVEAGPEVVWELLPLKIPRQIDLSYYAIGKGVLSIQVLGEWHELGECSDFMFTRTENEQAQKID